MPTSSTFLGDSCHAAENGLDNIEELGRRGERHQFHERGCTGVSLSGRINFGNAFIELGRNMPGGCIPGKVKTALIGILLQQNVEKPDHLRGIFLLREEVGNLICREFQRCSNDQASFASLSLRYNSDHSFRR